MAEGVQKVNDENFEAEVEKYEGTVVVDLGAGWCPPCKILEPIIAEVAAEAADRAKVLSCDVDESRNIATRFNILNVPTLIFFKNGEEKQRLVGVVPKEMIIEEIDKLAS